LQASAAPSPCFRPRLRIRSPVGPASRRIAGGTVHPGAARTLAARCLQQAGRVPENMPVCTDNVWQIWTFKTGTGALAFSHVDGTLRMVRQPDGNEVVAPASPLAPAVAGQSHQHAEIYVDPHERVRAAVRVLPQPPPPPLADEGFASSQPTTSSTFAHPAAYRTVHVVGTPAAAMRNWG
jgi:hypothetical protein